ncbi:F-box/kelch-repeat protein At3g06240-like isoform X3 [Papaver somniferum]|nr:F-box/kelch-repeat protein At3g06240-like isoform X3 [Papaver somniferum]
MASLPEDMIVIIVSKLPVKSISRFRCVCKRWCELFKNPKFIKTHLHHAIENNKFSVLLDTNFAAYLIGSDDENRGVYKTIDFDLTSSLSYPMAVRTDLPQDTFLPGYLRIYSCDGLIVLSTGSRKMICLWNPSTREYKDIPTPTSNLEGFSRYGVCYDWKIDDYKLFKLVANPEFSITSEVWVSRLGSNSWNNIGNLSYNVNRSNNMCVKPLNGIIHWIGDTEVIVSFDIVEERTKEIQVPSCYLHDCRYSYEDMEVVVLGEELCLSVHPSGESNIELWIMKDYGVTDSWTKIFSLSRDTINFYMLLPLHYLNKNREILLQGLRLEGRDALVSYNPKSGRLVALDIPGMPKHFNATTFVGSLVSLNSGEFVKASKISEVNTSAGAYKFFSLTVERAISEYWELRSRSFCLKWLNKSPCYETGNGGSSTCCHHPRKKQQR